MNIFFSLYSVLCILSGRRLVFFKSAAKVLLLLYIRVQFLVKCLHFHFLLPHGCVI